MAHEDDIRHEGAWNSFQFDPAPLHGDVLLMANRAEELGYRFLFREAGYSLEEVQTRLRFEGPSAFLKIIRLQEDISPKAPLHSAEQFLAARLRRLEPESELIITDPYFFTRARRSDADVYAASVARIVGPLLQDNVALTVISDRAVGHVEVEQAVQSALNEGRSGLEIRIIYSNEFHDRFWIVDRSRGIVMGTSLNKIGGKVFFVDALSDQDVAAVLVELEQCGV